MEKLKAHSAAKIVLPRGKELENEITEVMSIISNIVGGTLGPGGRPVLIERSESNLPPYPSKDGITVFRALGFQKTVHQTILETVRAGAMRTANEAGDATTTCTILSESIRRYTSQYCTSNPGVSPQAVVRDLQKVVNDYVDPELERQSVKIALEGPGAVLAHACATISANGDTELADAVLASYAICGDSGNVTIIDVTGSPPRYEVEKIDGYPIGIGFEQSCGRFYPDFINDRGAQRCILDKPMFVLYYGKITTIQALKTLVTKLEQARTVKDHNGVPQFEPYNMVLVATGFSEEVQSLLMQNMADPQSMNIYPLMVPQDSPIHNAQRHFLDDLAAITNARVFDQVTYPLDRVDFKDIGNLELDSRGIYVSGGIQYFESNRFRSTVTGHCSEDRILVRADEIQNMIDNSGSELDKTLAQERLGKLTGGIAKLKVIGSSNGSIKERRDRAEDAICAVRGALIHGVLPGGGWALAHLVETLPHSPVIDQVLIPALKEPIKVLYENVGITKISDITDRLFEGAGCDSDKAETYNCLTHQWVPALESGLVDSAPAVREAIKNSLDIASLLGTLGGVICQPRNGEFDKIEARDSAEFERMTHLDVHER